MVGVEFNFISTRIEIYKDYFPSGGVNIIPLFVYVFLVFFIARLRYSAYSPYFNFIFRAFVAAILLACFTSFNELLSYRFLQVAKGLSLPLLLLSFPYFVRDQLARRINF
jgi:hypothetical protein